MGQEGLTKSYRSNEGRGDVFRSPCCLRKRWWGSDLQGFVNQWKRKFGPA